MYVCVVLLQVWFDPRLVWDVKDYGNLVELHFGDHEIWQPDMCLYNKYIMYFYMCLYIQ